MARHEIRLDARTLSYLDTGSPPAAPAQVLVLLHAFPLDARMWRPQMDARPRGWRVLAPDLPGLGRSGDREPPVSIDDYADAAVGLLDALGIGRAVVGGLSMGGYAALALVRRAPDRVRGLLLADTRAEADGEEARAGRAALLGRLEHGGPPAVADEMVPKLLGQTTRRERSPLEADVRRQIAANRPTGIADAIRRMRDRPPSTPLLAAIRCPALIVVGEEDVVTPPDTARALHAAIPGSRLAVIPRAGHLSNLEQPDAFNEALHRWLADLAA